MVNYTLILFDRGIDIHISQYKEWRASSFPFWGDYTCLDFFLTQFNAAEESKKVLIIEDGNRKSNYLLQPHWAADKAYSEIQQVSNLETLIQIIEAQTTPYILLSPLSYIPLIDKEGLLQLMQAEHQLVKVSINNIPIDLYIAERTRLVGTIRSFLNRSTWQTDFIHFLFTDILNTSFGEIRNLVGRILYQNNLTDLYKSHIQLINKVEDTWLQKGMNEMLQLGFERDMSFITKDGHIRQSILSSKVRIEGYVENSFIFPGVIIEKKTRVINSVIMNNNHIGKNSIIQNTLILPYTREVMKGNANIEDKVCIGDSSRQVKNTKYPEQIYDGLTVLGINSEIPRGLIVEQGCYLEGELPAGVLKKMAKVKKGYSLFKSEVETR
jgi:hypothetical protein